MGLLRIIFLTFVTEFRPFIDVRILFPLNIMRKMDRISPNLIYAFILTRSRLELLAVIFCLYVTELWSLIDVRISFLLNISLEPIDRI